MEKKPILEYVDITRCINCDHELQGPFCAHCGRPRQPKRINRSYVLSEIAGTLNFQKGILFTVRALLLRPGKSIREFLREDRTKLVKPIGFIVLCSLVYIVAQQSLHFEDGYIDYSGFDWGDTVVAQIMEWISKNYGFANILIAVFIAGWVKIFFTKYDYNFFEILILLYFVMGMQMLLFSVFGMFEYISGLSVLDKGSIIALLYFCWAVGRFFDKREKSNYLKGFFSYMLGLISFTVTAILCGMLIDLIV